MRTRRTLNAKQRRFLAIRCSESFRMSPQEHRTRIEGDESFATTARDGEFEEGEDDVLDDDDCPAFDDMDGEEDEDDSDEW